MKILLKSIVFLALILIITVTVVNYTNFNTNTGSLKKAQTATPVSTAQTAGEIATIISEELVENALLNVEVEQYQSKQTADIFLQNNEFSGEEALLKNSYSLIKQIFKLEDVDQITLRWYMLIENKNTEVVTIILTKNSFMDLKRKQFSLIPDIALYYFKHDIL